jgi:hypothetical protein
MQDNGNSESEIPSGGRQGVKPLVKAGSWLILLVIFLPLILIIALLVLLLVSGFGVA